MRETVTVAGQRSRRRAFLASWSELTCCDSLPGPPNAKT